MRRTTLQAVCKVFALNLNLHLNLHLRFNVGCSSTLLLGMESLLFNVVLCAEELRWRIGLKGTRIEVIIQYKAGWPGGS